MQGGHGSTRAATISRLQNSKTCCNWTRKQTSPAWLWTSRLLPICPFPGDENCEAQRTGVRFSIFADSVATGVGPGWCVCGCPDGRGTSEIPYAHQIIGGCGQSKHPTHALQTAMPQFLQQPNGLHPTEDLLYLFTGLLADAIPAMPRRPVVHGTLPTPLVLRHMEPPLNQLSALRVQHGDLLVARMIVTS